MRTSVEVLDALLLDVGLLDLVRQPSGPFAGLSTIEIEPVNTCTRFVPRSRRRMSVCPRVAALRAAPRGCLLANTWLVSFPFSISTKYFLSPMRYSSSWSFAQTGYNHFSEQTAYCAHSDAVPHSEGNEGLRTRSDVEGQLLLDKGRPSLFAPAFWTWPIEPRGVLLSRPAVWTLQFGRRLGDLFIQRAASSA